MTVAPPHVAPAPDVGTPTPATTPGRIPFALGPVLELGRRPAVTAVAGMLAVVIGVNAHLVVTVLVSGFS